MATTERHRSPNELVVEVTVDGSGDLPAEGYRLTVAGTDDEPTATVVGADSAGAFYGTQTLLALVRDAGDGTYHLPRIEIDDHPDLAWRGTIEGFYGPPWSHADRLAHLDFAGRHKLNAYVYAPKDDPYHRQQWREPYPDEELARMGELVALAERRHVRFVFSVSPGLSMVYSDPAEVDLLVRKLEQVWKVGVRDIALLFDDIPPELEHEADVAAFGSEPGSSARAHAAVCAQVQERFRHVHGAQRPLIMVPTDYAGTQSSPYREHLTRELPDDVLVWWTGRDIVVGDITRAEIDAAAASYGHRLLLWDNFPVNDFDFARLFLGPLVGRTTEVAGSELVGITANPMPHEAASEIALATVADWAWNLGAYDPDAAHARALQVVPDTGRIRRLVESCRTWPPSAPRAPQLSAWIEALMAGGSDRAVAESGLRDAFTAMINEEPAGEPAGRLEREVAPWLRAQAAVGRAGLAALDQLNSPSSSGREAVEQALAAAEACEQNVLHDVVLPLARNALDS